MERECKTLSFSIKATGITTNAAGQDVGQIEAYGAVFNNVDDGNDKILPGSFKRTIKNSKERAKSRNKDYVLPMLWNHDEKHFMPLGGWYDVSEDDFGLLAKGDVLLATQTGREYYELAKAKMTDMFSIIYDVPQGGAHYDKSGVRELTELRLFSIDPVVFAMNDETYLVGVKSMDLEYKTVCGNTSGPIGPRDESWDGSAAEKWIWSKALGDDGEVKSAVAKKYFMVCDGDPTLKGSYHYPFWIDDHISVGAVKAIAAAIQGARGADAPTGLKAKVETLYNRISKKYPDNPLPPVPWKNDDGKRSNRHMQRKTFEEHYAEEQCCDLLEDWQDVVICALSKAILDAFTIGDTPETDVKEALTAFNDAVMEWVAQGMQYGLSDYLEENSSSYSPAESLIQYGSDSRPNYGGYGYFSRQTPMTRKAMYAGDATTGGFVSGKADGANMGPVIVTQEHVDRLNNAATKAMKAITTHTEALHNAADEVTTLIGGGTAVTPNEKRALPYGHKAGRTFSAANVQALSQHADDLHDLADSHTKTMKRQVKAITNVADDLATILQGSEAAYGSDRGTPDDGNQEGKRSQRTPYIRTRTAHSRPSPDDTVTEDEIEAALAKLTAL